MGPKMGPERGLTANYLISTCSRTKIKQQNIPLSDNNKRMIRLSAFVTLAAAAALSTTSAFVPSPPLFGRTSTIAQQPATAPRTTSLDGESSCVSGQGTTLSRVGRMRKRSSY